MLQSRFTRRSLALLMGLLLLFSCVLPAAAAPSDGFVPSDGQMDPDGAAAVPSDGNGMETPETSADSDGDVETEAGATAPSSDGNILATVSVGSDSIITVQNANGYIDDGRRAPTVDENRLPTLLADELPVPGRKFSLRDEKKVTAVRDQNPYGTCWAFAALASAESSLLMRDRGTHDFSELHLVHYTYHRSAEVAGILGTGNDIVKHLDKSFGDIYSTNNTMMCGGNNDLAISTLASGLGPVDEATLRYPAKVSGGAKEDGSNPSANARHVIAGDLSAAAYAVSKNTAQFDYAYTVNPKTNPTLVKQLLMTSGAASISYCDTQSYNTSVIPYAFYCNTNYVANHAVTLCGWDDDYAVSNFNDPKPANPGAWLCKNSWGDTDSPLYNGNYYMPAWGDGYFWISYENATLTDACFYGMIPAEEGYDYIYQHDGGNYSYWVESGSGASIYGASVFTAKSHELLEAVRVGLNSANNTVTLKVYKNLTNTSNPTSGTLVSEATKTHSCPYAGTYTLELENPVILDTGEHFSVVVQATSTSGNPSILCDFPYNSAQNNAVYRSSLASYSGKSFYSNNGTSWNAFHLTLTTNLQGGGSIVDTASADLRIKALSSDPGYIPTGVPGDVNANGCLDLADAVIAARIAVGKSYPKEQQKVANVTTGTGEAEGAVTVYDVQRLCRALVGIDGWRAPAVEEGRAGLLLAEDAALPTSFDLRAVDSGDEVKSYMTPVRNQNPYGTCWAFAALASAESNLLMQGKGEYDFSELHLVHYTCHRSRDTARLLGTGSDYVAQLVKRYDTRSGETLTIYRNAMQGGGNDRRAMTTLAAGLGPIAEEDLAYPRELYASDGRAIREDSAQPSANVKRVIAGSLEAGVYAVSRNEAQFDHAYILSPRKNPALVKRLLMERGAASVSYCDIDSYYNKEIDPWSYYCPTAYAGNHAVTLCGWDDAYPKENFRNKPKADGAWLCKNSWGAGLLEIGDSTYIYAGGMSGYFYISYEDPTLGDACFYGMKAAGEGRDFIYQHDGGTSSNYSADLPYGASVFTASHGGESLEAVRVSLGSANNTVTIRAYTGLTNQNAPTSGRLSATAVHVCPYAGVYTLDFDEAVPLEAGTLFSVVVELKTSGGVPILHCDSTYTDAYRTTVATLSGGGFLSRNGTSWAKYDHEPRIKALTRAAPYTPSGIPGDVNASGRLDLADAVIAARIAVGWACPGTQRAVADVFHAGNELTGTVNLHDVLWLCKALVGSSP